MELLHDSPGTKDQLGFGPSVTMLCEVIRDTRPPFAIGVFGEWGCGKTTLMQMVRERLDSETGNYKSVWFNAWKYDGKEVIWNALIQEIFFAMKKDPEVESRANREEFIGRVKKTATDLARYAAKVATRLVPGGVLKEDDVDEVVRAFSAADSDFEFVNTFESTFDSLVKEYVGEHGKLIVFIDDIDRCLPENAIAVLEALKLYLDRTNCMFLIGAERAVVEEGIRHRYRDNPRLSATEYLEKIVQLPFMMRGIEPQNALSLLDPYEKTVDYRGDSVIRELIVAGTQCNPRRIKQFVNTFYVLSHIGNLPQGHEQHGLAKVLLIQMRFPDLYNALLRDLSIVQYLTSAIQAPSTQRDQMLAASPQVTRELYEDANLRKFLERTQNIECAPEEIEHWVLVTKGQPQSPVS